MPIYKEVYCSKCGKKTMQQYYPAFTLDAGTWHCVECREREQMQETIVKLNNQIKR